MGGVDAVPKPQDNKVRGRGGVTRRAARGLHKALPAFRAALLARQNFKSLRVTVTRDSGGGGGGRERVVVAGIGGEIHTGL